MPAGNTIRYMLKLKGSIPSLAKIWCKNYQLKSVRLKLLNVEVKEQMSVKIFILKGI